MSPSLRAWAFARARGTEGSGGAGIGCLSTLAILGLVLPTIVLVIDGGATDWLVWSAGGWLLVLAIGAFLLHAGGKNAVEKKGKALAALLENGQIAQATVLDHQVTLRDDQLPERTLVLLVAGRTLRARPLDGEFAASLPRGAVFDVLHDGASDLVIPTFEIPRS